MLLRPLDEIAEEAKAWATSDHPRIGIGYPMFDDRTSGGAAQGEVILFTARSSVGKTAFAVNVIENNPDVPTVKFSLEMHGRYILNRLTAAHTGTSTATVENQLRLGVDTLVQRTVDDFPRLAIADKPGMSFKDMHVALAEATERWDERPRLVVIDYMELIGGVVSLEAASAIQKVSRKMKDFAREEDVVLLCLHQVSRGSGAEGHMPLSVTSGNLGGETAADYVLGAYRPCLEPGIGQQEYLRRRPQYMLQFLKTRGGAEIHPAGMLHHYDPLTMRISDPANPERYAPAPGVYPSSAYDERELSLVGLG